MRTILILTITFLLLVPVPRAAQAQAWQTAFEDNGVWFEGWLASPDQTLFLWCGGQSPGSPGLPQTDEPMLTEPGTVDLALRLPGLDPSDPALFSGVRTDLMIVAAGQGFGLPEAYWDELNAMGWVQRLGLSDPLFAALAMGGDVQVWAGGARIATYGGAGLAEGLATITGQCNSLWQEAGPAGHPETTAMLSDATVEISTGCGGNVDLGPGHALTGDIDGDGIADLVIDWAAITCLSGAPRPFCGAAYCSATVYLSSRPDRRPFERLLAAGLALEPMSDGRARPVTGVTAGSCPQTTRPDRCETVWQWTGADLVALPPGGG